MIAIIDYGVGNLFSLKSSLAQLGQDTVVTADPDTIRKADRLILPGVGAFGDAMDKLVGQAWLDRVDVRDKALFITGRISCEMALKAHRAGCPVLVSRKSATDEAARRAEELGVTGEEPEFLFAQRNEYHGAFHGKPFHDNEIAWVYLLVLDRPEEAFTPEACEVESVHWFSVREILRAMRENDPRFCLREAEFCRLLPYLAQKFGVPVDKL